MAIAEHHGMSRKTRDQWMQLAQRYHVPTEAGDLFAGDALAVERAAPDPDQVELAEDLERALEGKRKAASAPRRRRFARLGSNKRRR